MLVIRHENELPPEIGGIGGMGGTVVALGNFDGFHRGHQVVIGEAGRIAREQGLKLVVVTTEPHPRQFFDPDQPPFRLTPFRERVQLLEGFGVDAVLILNFDKDLAGTTANEFMGRILVDGLNMKYAVVGYDYRFGKSRGGNTDVMRSKGAELGFEVKIINPVAVGVEGSAGEIYSSTLVREALRKGEARRAASLLGHWWTLNGRIQQGDKRGRTIGFPTANIPFQDSLEPSLGVYAVRVLLEGRGDVLKGVANLGRRPTFDKKDVLLEVHLFDFDEDIYGLHARVELVSYIRKELKFASLDMLKAQISNDCLVAKTILADPENTRNHLPAPTLDGYLAQFPVPQ
jgi:riboflavin kinase/FMN adenylyltransferase